MKKPPVSEKAVFGSESRMAAARRVGTAVLGRALRRPGFSHAKYGGEREKSVMEAEQRVFSASDSLGELLGKSLEEGVYLETSLKKGGKSLPQDMRSKMVAVIKK